MIARDFIRRIIYSRDLEDRVRVLVGAVEYLLERMPLMATQAEVNAVVAQLKDDEAGIAAVDQHVTDAATKLQAELDALAAANPALDLSGFAQIHSDLQAVSQALSAHVDAVGNLTPTPPSP